MMFHDLMFERFICNADDERLARLKSQNKENHKKYCKEAKERKSIPAPLLPEETDYHDTNIKFCQHPTYTWQDFVDGRVMA